MLFALAFIVVPLPLTQGQKLSAPMPDGHAGTVGRPALALNGTWLVWVADAEELDVFELFSVDYGGGARVQLSGPLVAGGDVSTSAGGFLVSPDSSRVVYLADQETDGKLELYSVAIGGGPTVKLGPALPANGDVVTFAIAADSSRVVLLANAGTPELYSAPLAGGAATRLNAALVAGGAVSHFAVSADSTRVVYRADQLVNEVHELFSVPLAGGAVTKLNPPLATGGDVSSSALFRIAADSSRVVYAADQMTDGVQELWSVPVAGGSATQLSSALAPNGDVGAFEVAPDSSRVVYGADQDADELFELYSVPLAGGAVAQLNAPLIASGDVATFRIAPDSSRVVYSADQETEDVIELYGVPLAGGPVVELSPPLVLGGNVEASVLSMSVAITPDSARVVYRADAEVDGVSDLYSAPLAGGPIVKLDPTLAPDRDVGFIAISPDSTRVVYQADQDANDINELFSVPVTGGPAQQVTPDSSTLTTAFAIVIAPDSASVAYLANAEIPVAQVFRSPILGLGGAATLLSGPVVSVPSAGDVASHAASPDGRRVVYLADQLVDERVELFSVAASGGPVVRLNAPLIGSGDVTKFTVSPDSTTVLYLADQESEARSELYRVPIAGGPVVRLNATLPIGPGTVEDFALSPDGTLVVYRAVQELFPDVWPGALLYTVPLSGGVPIRLTDPIAAFPPESVASFRITPDSQTVVFQHAILDTPPGATNPYAGLYRVPILGGSVVELCPPAGYCLSYHIAPDSSRVTFTADLEVARRFELYGVPLAGGPLVKLNPQLGDGAVGTVTWCPFPSCEAWPPSFVDTWTRFAPDSSRVVFTARESASSPPALYSALPAGGATLLAADSVAGSGIRDAFAVSADSSRVTYLAPSSATAESLYSVPAGGGAPTLLAGPLHAGGSVLSHATSPDSARVAFVADRDANDVFELYSVPLGGGAVVRLSAPGGGVSSFTISADSRWVTYLAAPGASGVHELFLAPLDGGAPARRLSVPLVAGGDVHAWTLTPDSRLALYEADADRDETRELYGAPLTRVARRAGPP